MVKVYRGLWTGHQSTPADEAVQTQAFNEPLKGPTAEELRYATAVPAVDPSFIDKACKRFTAERAYLDYRLATPTRFLAKANLSVVIRCQEQHVESAEARGQLNDRVRDIFADGTFGAVPFSGGPFDVTDEAGNGRPRHVVFAYDWLARRGHRPGLRADRAGLRQRGRRQFGAGQPSPRRAGRRVPPEMACGAAWGRGWFRSG